MTEREMAEHDTVQTGVRLAQRLDAARRKRFVGRTGEVARFAAALAAPDPPFAVLHIYGPGGIGKTTLLHELGRIAQQAGRQVIYIDGRDVDPSPAGLLTVLGLALGIAPAHTSPARLAGYADLVLLVDTYEVLEGMDSWLRNVLLPNLGARSLAIIAGRHAPAAAWRTDLAWGELTQTLALRNLARDEARVYLATRGVAPTAIDAALDFTHGHPLALSLVADLLTQDAEGLPLDTAAPQLLHTLLARFLQSVPDAQHRLGLEICAHIRNTTETILTTTLGEQGSQVFAWLRELSFIEQGPFGLFPHDLARDVLDNDLRWRDPVGYVALHRRVRAALVEQFQSTTGIVQQQIFQNILFLHRTNAAIRPYYDWSASQAVFAEPATPQDYPALLDIFARHSGPATVKIVDYWLKQQPDAFFVVRTPPDSLMGVLCMLTLQQPTPQDCEIDPVVAAAWQHMQSTAPLQPGEIWTLDRFWEHVELSQQPSPVFNMGAVLSARAWLQLPNLSWSILVTHDYTLWRPAAEYVRHIFLPTGVQIGPQMHHMAYHDWRLEPWQLWMDAMAEEELGHATGQLSGQSQSPAAVQMAPIQRLSADDFAQAVRGALRDYHRPDQLAKNPLLHSGLLHTAPGVAALQAELQQAIDLLQAHPRDARLYRALYHTYLEPGISQEQIAEALDLPFSTYRHHLTQGIRRVVEWLWQRELEATRTD